MKGETQSEGGMKGDSHEFSFGFQEEAGFDGWKAVGKISANQQWTKTNYSETTWDETFTSSEESAKASEQTSSQYVSDSQEFTETAASGSISPRKSSSAKIQLSPASLMMNLICSENRRGFSV